VTKSFDLIRYNSAPSFADLVIDLPYYDYVSFGAIPVWRASIQNVDFAVAPNAKIFCKTDLLRTFASFFANIQIPIHLITGVSDINPLDIEGAKEIIANPNILSWVGNNLPPVHEKILTLPIGFRESSRGAIRFPKVSEDKKQAVILTSHGPTSSERGAAASNLDGVVFIQEQKLPQEEYLSLLGDYRYSLCLQGNGLDTHRVYESIAMSCIPVVLSSPLAAMYEAIGAIVIGSLDELNPSFVESNKHAILPDKHRVELDYWRNAVTNFQNSREKLMLTLLNDADLIK